MTDILIVDDDKEIAELIEIYLKNEGYQSIKAHDGLEALKVIEQQRVDLVILDVMMPKLDGLAVCMRIREKQATPVLMLSAKAEDMDKIMGLMTGADDYMVKPFNPLELVARVKSLLRRAYQLNARLQVNAEPQGIIRMQGLEINKETHSVKVDGHVVHLTSMEFDILYLMAGHPGRVFSAEELYERVWKEGFNGSHNTVAVHISKLRDKLESSGGKFIQTVWGVGYKIEQAMV
ncbi:response regulator transcription factor [Paenibacillus apiarius]|uniref:Response regulator transcription factor n=1 Tax=Paenibacillus apiarius TaxID=46240 RepID=A0ABT4DTK6_9BACL|nr:response regulator transcription factor [Paenibacillus apiarius]MCY9514292.1 response regulator transcription factor [Paenibacillus apiarius]MCY9520125.1 response regulator transcription factor [Paenibacillus apiarius]MCY9550132.1 response regulator transcription factor [Paenibacillus apiarius]MCY9560257.1 response regulator transcription factor [Paenibacillus apiarius]MCY9683155.1 response regulator transcription factor [Paenibacillus apiarius]